MKLRLVLGALGAVVALAAPADALGHGAAVPDELVKEAKKLLAEPHVDGFMPEEPLDLVGSPSLALLPDCRTAPQDQPCMRYCPPAEEIGEPTDYPCRVEHLALDQDDNVVGNGGSAITSAVDAEDLTRSAAARRPVCGADPHIHVLYGTTRGSNNFFSQRYGQILGVLSRSNARLYRDSGRNTGADTGGAPAGRARAQYKVRCREDGQTLIEHVHFNNINATNPNEGCGNYVLAACVIPELQRQGHNSSSDKYLLFLEVNALPRNPDVPGDVACGEGERYEDERTAAQGNIHAGATPMYAAVYTLPDRTPQMSIGAQSSSASGVEVPQRDVPNCLTSTTAMHENAHTMGAVQRGAPHIDWYNPNPAHCNETWDVMCGTAAGTGYTNPGAENFGDRCANSKSDVQGGRPFIVFDCRFDDYFNMEPDGLYPSDYLATRWNIADPLNGYLYFN